VPQRGSQGKGGKKTRPLTHARISSRKEGDLKRGQKDKTNVKNKTMNTYRKKEKKKKRRICVLRDGMKSVPLAIEKKKKKGGQRHSVGEKKGKKGENGCSFTRKWGKN